MKLIKAGSRILFSRISQIMANALVILIVAKKLGPEAQGYYSLTAALALLLASLFAGGMGLAAVPPLRQNAVEGKRMLSAQLLWIGAMVVLLFSLAWLSTSRYCAPFLASHLGWQPGFGYFAATAGTGILCFEIFSYNLLAKGRLFVGAAVNGVRASGHLLLIILITFIGTLNLGLSIGAFALAHLAGAIAILTIVIREFNRNQLTSSDTSANTTVQPAPVVPAAVISELPADLGSRSLVGLIGFNLRHGYIGQISAVAYFLLLRLDQGFVEFYHTAADVGVYSVAVHMGEMLWLLPGALMPLLVHSSSAIELTDDRDRTALLAVRLGILVTAAVGIPLFILAKPLLSLLAGGQYAESGAALRSLLPGIVAFAPGTVLAGDFIGRGKPHWNTQASTLTLIVNVIGCVILIPRYGIVGAGWASSVAYTCGALVMIIRFQRVTGLSIFRRC